MADDEKRIVEAGEPSVEYQVVDAMAQLMKNELDENHAKKHGREHWLKGTPLAHIVEIYLHTAKLQMAFRAFETLKANPDSSRHEIQFQEARLKEFAADVANHATMFLDVMELLGVPVIKPRAEKKATPEDLKKHAKINPQLMEPPGKEKSSNKWDYDDSSE